MIGECNLLMVRGINNRLIEMVLFCCSDCVQMFDWDQDNVIVTGSTDGIVRVRTSVPTGSVVWTVFY